MKAGELCNRAVVTTTPYDSVVDAARSMSRHDVGSLVVIEEVGGTVRPVGVITDRDLAIRALARGEPVAGIVRDVMDGDLVTAGEDDEVDAVLARLRRRAVRRVPIVGKDGRLVGVLTLDDIIGWISEELRDAAALIDRQARDGVP